MWLFDPKSEFQLLNTLTREKRKLKARELEVFQCLVDNEGRYVNKMQILSEVWPGRVVSEANITQSISRIRIALGDTGKEQRIIKTQSKLGYMLLPSFVAVRSNVTHVIDAPLSIKTRHRSSYSSRWPRMEHALSYLICLAIAVLSTISLTDSLRLLSADSQSATYLVSDVQYDGVQYYLDSEARSFDFYELIRGNVPVNNRVIFIFSGQDVLNISCIYFDHRTQQELSQNLVFSFSRGTDFMMETMNEKCH